MATHDDMTEVDEALTDDSGCTVDWGWLRGLQIESAVNDLQHLRIRFADGQTLTIQAAMYQGKPFLAFDPYKPRS